MALKNGVIAPFHPIPASPVTSPHFKAPLDIDQDIIENMEEVTLGHGAVLPKASQVLVGVVMEQENAAALSPCP